MIKINWVTEQEGEFISLDHFRLIHPEGIIAAVDDIEVVGECEICGDLVFDSEPAMLDEDGIIVHLKCEVEEEAYNC
jgi:hypothetical protein